MGQGVVQQFSNYLQRRFPGIQGFSASNVWRMRQFYDLYEAKEKLAPLVREIPWTHNLIIMARVKNDAVVEYAMSRSLSPAMVAEYRLHLPDRRVLEAKLHELTDMATLETADPDEDG
ncbi:MAG: DUF1016 N-terminal domain-containing protein [Propionibacteriaceae bacterium]|jgi:hypothetical protein|nr:DUF1016 N-terminal domain-containing protein [Propionibacteriaceae bacterium]